MNNNILKSLLLTSMMASLITGCGGEDPTPAPTEEPTVEPTAQPTVEPTAQPTVEPTQQPVSNYKELDSSTAAEIWVMTWSGDGKDHLDIGNNPLPANEVNALNVGMLQGIAKEFNQIYPNVKINLHTEIDDPASGGTSWSEKLINFKESHNGKYPDVWASFNIIDDLNKGIVGDLSVFEEDPDYQELNPDLMNLMNYYGFQAGLPQYAIPWGIYVNRELATSNNIPAPLTDWTWDEYTDFVSAAEQKCAVGEFCGAYDASMMAPRGAFIERQLQVVEKGSDYQVNFANSDFVYAISKLPAQSKASAMGVLSGIVDTDPVAKAYMDKGGYWGYNYFKDNLVLTYDGDPWMLFESTVPGAVNFVNSGDWDIYPRPAFENEDGEFVVENHVGVCLDPLAVYNYALDDGNPELSDAEYEKMKIAWTFAKFWVGDTRAWEAKADSYYTATNATTGELYEVPAINDTFPAIKQGPEFDKQMEVWYSTDNHKAYANKEKFKGFAKVVELWSEGNIYGISDKAFPRYYYLEGDATAYPILEKIDGFGNAELVGVDISDPSWLSTYSALLRSFNFEINGWYNQAFTTLKETLKTYYGWEDSDF